MRTIRTIYAMLTLLTVKHTVPTISIMMATASNGTPKTRATGIS